MNLSRVVVIVAVTAAIVYAGLNFLLPKHGKAGGEAAVAEAGFGTEAAAPAAEAATEAAPAETAAAEAPAADSSEAPAAEAPAAETAGEAPSLSDEEARAIAANVAAEAASGDSAAAGDSAASGLTDAQRAAIAANVASEGSGDAAEPTPPPAAPAPAPAPAPVEEVAAAPAPAPAPAPAAAPKPRKPAPAPKPAAAPAPATAPTHALNNGADVITAWWKQSSGSASNLNLVYVGESTKDKAVVLVFDNEVDAAAAGAGIKLVDAKGSAPQGSWSNGNNGRVLAFKGVPTGRYTVIIDPTLASTGGKTVGRELFGPVYVR